MNPSSPHALLLCLDPGIQWSSPKGAALHLREVARGFLENGYRVTLMTRQGIGELTRPGQTMEDCRPVEPKAVRRFFRSDTPSPATRAAGLVAANPYFFEAALDAVRRRPVQVVYERLSLWSDLGVRLSSATSAPLVVEVNAPLVDEQRRYRTLASADFAAELEQRTLIGATRVVTVSRWLAGWAEGRGVDSGAIRCLPNIADAQRFFGGHYRAPRPGKPFRVGFSGSLKSWHGLEGFLSVFAVAARCRPQLELEILGDGPERDALSASVESLGIGDRVSFHGHVDHHRLGEYYKGWHLAVAPYPALHPFYFSPLKIADAMAAGLPVLASDLGDIGEMLGHGEFGLTLTPGDDDIWTRTIIDLVDRPDQLERMAARALGRARSWSWARQVRRSLEGLNMNPNREQVHAAS